LAVKSTKPPRGAGSKAGRNTVSKADNGSGLSGTFIRGVISGDRLSHAYIAAGALADSVVAAAVCSERGDKPCLECAQCKKAARNVHPDITVIKKPSDKRDILVEQIRLLKKDVIVIPIESENKAYLIVDADLMNTQAQNAFLQILEEPPPHVVFILKTDHPGELLPTIRSRCVHLKEPPGPQAQPGQLAQQVQPGLQGKAASVADEFFSALLAGNDRLVAFMFRLEKLDRDAFGAFIDAAGRQLSLKLTENLRDGERLSAETLSRAERVFLKAGEMFDQSVNTGHISGMICASLIDT